MTPRVCRLDARRLGVDDAGLHAWARTVSQRHGGVHVSRSYRFPYAYVAWHSGPVGIDIEQITRCDETLADLICTPDERRLFPLPGDGDGDEVLTALWSSKEALTKALGDAVLYDPSRLDAPSRWVEGRSGPWHFAQLPSPAGHVAGMCWADSRGPRRPSERSQQVV